MYSFAFHRIQTKEHLSDATKNCSVSREKEAITRTCKSKFCDKCFDFRLYLEVEKAKGFFSAFYKKQALILKCNPPPPPPPPTPAPPLARPLHLVPRLELLLLLLNLQGSVPRHPHFHAPSPHQQNPDVCLLGFSLSAAAVFETVSLI